MPRVSLQLIFGFLTFLTLLLMTLLTAHYKSYGPLQIVATVKKANTSFSLTKRGGILFSQHLQFVEGLQSYSNRELSSSQRQLSSVCSKGRKKFQSLPFTIESLSQNYTCASSLHGFLLPSGSQPLSEISSIVQTDVIHLFSNEIVADLQNDFTDWGFDILAISPSMAIQTTHDNFELVLVSRISLNKEKIFLTGLESNMTETGSAMFDNYLYKSSWNRSLKKLRHGSLLKMNIPGAKKALSGDGPLDPRVFFINDQLHVLFNVVVEDQSTGNLADRIFIFVPHNGPDAIYELAIEGLTLTPRDKGWVPLIGQNNKLYFIYRFEPLVIISCDPKNFKKPCTVVTAQISRNYIDNGNRFNDKGSHLRGGTQFVEYLHPYYVGVCHGTFFTTTGTRYYSTHLALLNLQSQKLVYVSSDVAFSTDILKLKPNERPWVTAYPFFFPLGIYKSSNDKLLVSGHFNDAESALIQISGVQIVFDAAIAIDLKSVGAKLSDEQKHPTKIINSLLFRKLTKETNLTFVDV